MSAHLFRVAFGEKKKYSKLSIEKQRQKTQSLSLLSWPTCCHLYFSEH